VDVSELRQIIEHFIEEADEGTSQLEKLLTEFETTAAVEPLLEKICRTARLLNGSAAALGFADLASFTQKYENFLTAVKRKLVAADQETLTLMADGLSFIKDHVDSLRKRKKSPGKGELLIEQMERALKPKPLKQLIELPRQPLAGDIWFVGDDLKAELFELPEPVLEKEDATSTSQPETNDNSVPRVVPTFDDKIAAIQAEIARLTILAAHVNQTTVQAAETRTLASALENQTPVQAAQTPTTPQSEETQDTAQPEEIYTTEQAEEIPRIATDTPIVQIENASPEEPAPSRTSTVAVDEIKPVEEHDQTPFVESTHAISAAVAEFAQVLRRNARQEQAEDKDVSVNEFNSGEESIKVQAERIDRLIDLAGEITIIQSMLEEQKPEHPPGALQKRISQMSKAVRELQELSLTLRMINFRTLFKKMERIARDSSLKGNKSISVHFSGEESEIDKCVMERIAEPLTQLLRYCIFSGIESTDQRSAAGKPLRSQIQIKVAQLDEQVIFEISDDGCGLDLEKIRSRAVERGLLGHADKLSEEKTRALIFHRGFFSRRADSGDHFHNESELAQIAATVEGLQGRIETNGNKGQGTSFRLYLPRTVTVTEGFIVKLGRERFVVSKVQVSESIMPHESEVYVINGQTEMLNAKGRTIPLYHLSRLLKKEPVPAKPRTTFDGVALLIREGELQPFAIVVEQVLGLQRVVNKKLGEELQGIPGLSGGAILGDGKPSLILNLCELVKAQRSDETGERDTEAADRAA
jgi:two-component system chemotaxis sensor kinase CheA